MAFLVVNSNVPLREQSVLAFREAKNRIADSSDIAACRQGLLKTKNRLNASQLYAWPGLLNAWNVDAAV